MEKYRNSSGNSGISAYEIGPDYIKIRFSSGETYQYSYKKAGQKHVENMKRLAIKGTKLNTYLNTYVKFKND